MGGPVGVGVAGAVAGGLENPHLQQGAQMPLWALQT